ncbi:YodL domain-containing protein [Tissierella praeacuta]|uniref:YodL domain-containing protein n=1 Tax=Tissierella praeacuta TaxID=43131 RepID=UPI003342AB01
MSSIKLKNDCIFYYGNPAGYVEKDIATVDSMFQNEEFENWIYQRKLIPKWTEGVFERLSKGDTVHFNDELLIPLKSCRIWQLRTDVSPDRKFIGYEELKETFGEPDKDNYKIVYEGEIETNDLEEIYTKFNLNHPQGFTGHSLSISDVIELYDSTGSEFYYVDRFGFKEIDFEQKEQKQDMSI